ncbi:hypothetical protein BT67DRAFT_187736 [Trichocladium antarcticum]|uniref:Uncharacterized protein n=1 Tax=Trichocladium antarcticum TaxID=1450529 RepID=A0AAN6UPJ2_9PEZI|nr:hypothetical protein BT67DRAFT_187736 [Trichocladium antarcticum]
MVGYYAVYQSGLEPVQQSGLELVQQSGLEPVQPARPETALPAPPAPPALPAPPAPSASWARSHEHEAQIPHPGWQEQTYTYKHESYPDTAQSSKTQRILGLSVRTFWVVVVILVVLLAAGIGGGVGGSLAARRRAESAGLPAADGPATQTPPSPPPSSPTPEPPATDAATTTTTPAPTSTTARANAAAVSPAPTDGGCPDMDGTAYTPLDAGGRAIALRAGGAQAFRRLCATNYPSGALYGNPRIHDIVKLWLPSLEACIGACAAYNLAYEANAAGRVAAGGLCRSVAVVKIEGEYCYLKNGTGTNETFGRPSIYSSAVLLLE